MAGIYFHIPFCRKACHYCNFHFSTSMKTRDDVFRAMTREISLQTAYLTGETINTIYFGGGTPSILTKEELSGFLASINEHYNVASDAEITLEANPDDIDKISLADWRQAGINRLSIGIQAFQDTLLQAWNRSHNSHQATLSLDMALDAGFDNITADLIYGGIGLSDEDWDHNIDQLTSRQIPHVSSYALTVEQGTALFHQVDKGKTRMPDEEQANRQFSRLQEVLSSRGYLQYEVSNFSLPGFTSKHNQNYWRGEKYLGIGPSAHSYDGISRQWNIPHNIKYAEALSEKRIPFEKEILTPEQQYNEAIMTGLRTSAGIDIRRIQQLGEKYEMQLKRDIDGLTSRPGYRDAIQYTDHGHPVLHKDFLFFADGIASELFMTGNE